MKVLFVCRANAGRSQMAEAFYNSYIGSKKATSAGLDLKHSTKGDDLSLPDSVIEVMNEIGHDLSSHRRKELTEQMVNDADIVVVTSDYPLPSYLENSKKLVRWDEIPDAARTPMDFHRKVRDMVKKRVLELIEQTKTTSK
jgi:protein-tyrosine-phosphatase